MALTMGAVVPASKASESASGHVSRTLPSRGDSTTHSGEHFGSASQAPPTVVAPHARPIMIGPVNRMGRLDVYLIGSLLPAQNAPASMATRAPRYSQSGWLASAQRSRSRGSRG